MMVSKRQGHPSSRSEVVAKVHVLGSTLGVKVTTNASPAIPSKKKKSFIFPWLELQSEGIHGGMMVSKGQCHPSSRSEVVAKIHFWGSTLGVKVATKSI
jgi:hypothetical protein